MIAGPVRTVGPGCTASIIGIARAEAACVVKHKSLATPRAPNTQHARILETTELAAATGGGHDPPTIGNDKTSPTFG